MNACERWTTPGWLDDTGRPQIIRKTSKANITCEHEKSTWNHQIWVYVRMSEDTLGDLMKYRNSPGIYWRYETLWEVIWKSRSVRFPRFWRNRDGWQTHVAFFKTLNDSGEIHDENHEDWNWECFWISWQICRAHIACEHEKYNRNHRKSMFVKMNEETLMLCWNRQNNIRHDETLKEMIWNLCSSRCLIWKSRSARFRRF